MIFISALTRSRPSLSRKISLALLYRVPSRLFSSAAPSRPEIEERILKTLRASDKLDAAKLQLDTPFTQLGLDSLDVVEVIVNLEEEFHLQIPDAVADKAQNPKDVAEYIYNFLHPASKDNHQDNISEESH